MSVCRATQSWKSPRNRDLTWAANQSKGWAHHFWPGYDLLALLSPSSLSRAAPPVNRQPHARLRRQIPSTPYRLELQRWEGRAPQIAYIAAIGRITFHDAMADAISCNASIGWAAHMGLVLWQWQTRTLFSEFTIEAQTLRTVSHACIFGPRLLGHGCWNVGPWLLETSAPWPISPGFARICKNCAQGGSVEED